MPAARFAVPSAAWLARMVRSVICSMRPSPKTGVGMRKMTLPRLTCASKFSCAMRQPAALPVESERPLITNSACTPPSRLPSGLEMNRASRTGPSGVMNDGRMFRAPKSVATATWGFTAGEVPPISGCE